MMQTARTQDGFGMVVVALLFTAFAVIAAMMLDRDAVRTEIERQQRVELQLSRLNIALAQYARFNSDRFPCPASWLLAPDHANFGAAFSATCSAGAITPAVDGVQLATSSNNKLLMGMVPVKELVPYGVNYADAFDPWGSRIVYAVHRDLTTGTSGAAVAAALNSDRAAVGELNTGNSISPEPDVVLISYGRDRMGGRLRAQASLASPSIACSGGVLRIQNCDGDRTFRRAPLFTPPNADTNAYFDDSISALRYF